MAELEIVNTENKKVGTATLSPEVFEGPVREHLVQQYVVMQLATKRSGTASTIENRGDISGGGKKPWRQKGTGRARHGSTRSTIWRGGMTVFGPRPRAYTHKLSKKSRKLAIRSVLAERLQSNNIQVVESLNLEEPKTKQALALLGKLGLPEKTLFLVAEKNPNLELAVRNLPQVNVLSVEGVNVFDLLVHQKIVCTPDSLKKLEERLS
ncbi:50S ribosomal protein L4 [Nitrospina gracilis 3/211]|uniref:Large ribosomal subunit protein uL4 n=1 Tax=Nitrospina gracilis (strain 3/211) TaxID=1266370 RepID=M1YX99_NITG3|nr:MULTISPECIES: 50S ribosomal protein L4 [Nitrospina]MCF8723259.1 large subunit ribosomal protein L4 [Nitrospina sp. Nb-3]CCQ90309.1 50S ribosomal protein L4 [Nitrospina gracilis 3/211]